MNQRAEPSPDLALPRLGWSEVRDELLPAVDRLTGLLERVPGSAATGAVGAWSVAETAAHLTHVWTAIPMLARRDLATAIRTMPASEGLGTPSGSVFSSLDGLAPWTRRAVDAEPERDLDRIAQILRDRAQGFRAEEHEADESPRPWIFEGILGGPALFCCHALNETYVHGDDIARAAGDPTWTVDPHAAALIVRCFLLEVICQVTSADPEHGPRFCIDLRMIGHDPFYLVSDAAGMRMERPSGRPVDAHLRADPTSLLLTIWQRRNIPRLVSRGKLLLWGRRPWKIRELLTLKPDV